MAEQENNKDLISVLWSGADVLRSKMDANEYKNYLLGFCFFSLFQRVYPNNRMRKLSVMQQSTSILLLVLISQEILIPERRPRSVWCS